MSCRKEGGKWSAPAAPPAFQFREMTPIRRQRRGGREPHLSSRSKSERKQIAPELCGFAVPVILYVTSRCAVSQCAASHSLVFFLFLGRLEPGCPHCKS
ncbi:hypothetical protein ASPBRDRAFT_280325 [Aspergillus brasiliensis CBS 101740]|uniref:Uncharacterized protein n=1 Tax=Aspergillus brasiliensis (strain CBS 101740 / IMI 381727 / IBT 21946) TaxID=767769 RepID=A0A1L9UCV5_ASPBC|nr:hypothetical protein ASPBRDRAFT_280325 [Aspergillus brasiliensis CBS 101740]